MGLALCLRGWLEGFVMSTAFNLLRYPMQARQRRMRWRWGTATTGFWVGALAGSGLLFALQADMAALEVEREHGQAQALQDQTRLQQDKNRRDALLLVQRQQNQLAQVQQHQRAWDRLLQALLQGSARDGWRLERLQVDGERLELQGRIRDARALVAAQQRLSEALQQPLTLSSLLTGPAETADRRADTLDHVFVWQGVWPALHPAPVPAASRRLP